MYSDNSSSLRVCCHAFYRHGVSCKVFFLAVALLFTLHTLTIHSTQFCLLSFCMHGPLRESFPNLTITSIHFNVTKKTPAAMVLFNGYKTAQKIQTFLLSSTARNKSRENHGTSLPKPEGKVNSAAQIVLTTPPLRLGFQSAS